MNSERILFGVKVKLKSQSKFMKILNWFAEPINPFFMEKYYTTIFSTVYAPSSFDQFYNKEEKDLLEFKHIFEHEKVHIQDFNKYHIFYLITYFLPPFLSYGRFKWEARAFMPELKDLLESHQYSKFYNRLNDICNELASSRYFWCWFKKSMRKSFLKELKIYDRNEL